MLSTIKRIQWTPYIIDRQIYQRATPTSFDVDPQVDRSLSLGLPRVRQERCPHRA